MDQSVLDVMAELEMRNEREKLRGEDGIDSLDPDAAKLLYIMATGLKAKSIVEVGTGVGYSTLWLAAATQKHGGKVLTCEIDPAKADEARANFEKAGLSDHIEILVGDATDTLRNREGAVDLLFIDATFGHYETFLDVVYKRLQVGSMVFADNVVEDAYDLDDYISYVQNHPNLDSQTLKIGAGLEITVRIA